MQPAYWKVSMGYGTSGDDFKDVLDVLDWIRKGVVIVHKQTRAKGGSHRSQGEDFVDMERDGDYFYLCHGNNEPSILLFGQFIGPPNLFCERGDGWAERSFRWIRTSGSVKSFRGQQKWWAPNHNSTFIKVPDDDLHLFEEEILAPYFGFRLADFGIA